jgi:lactate dehydrogenase-like 2-hydroxyacid dehydrogenase
MACVALEAFVRVDRHVGELAESSDVLTLPAPLFDSPRHLADERLSGRSPRRDSHP